MREIWVCGACHERVHWEPGQEGKTLAEDHYCFEMDIDPVKVKIPDPGEIVIVVSVEGAKSFMSTSPGWGAMGLQEIEEQLLTELAEAGFTPPFKPAKA